MRSCCTGDAGQVRGGSRPLLAAFQLCVLCNPGNFLQDPAAPRWFEHGPAWDPLHDAAVASSPPALCHQAVTSSPLFGDRWDTVVAEQVPQLRFPMPLPEPRLGDGQITAGLIRWLSCTW